MSENFEDFETARKAERKKKKKPNKTFISMLITILLLVVILLIMLLNGCNGCVPDKTATSDNTPLNVEKTQGEYVKPEEPVNRSKQVTLPGWGGFTIPADTSYIDKGFEFHNPEENIWYEDMFSIDGEYLELLVVDSGETTDINHLLKLANIKSEVTEVVSYDSTFFNITDVQDTEEGKSSKAVEAIGISEIPLSIVVKCEDGTEHTIDVECQQNYYYMTFALYLGNPDDPNNSELLYQSCLVEPGMYIQQMEISHALEAGEYDAYVFIQPYRSDKATPTNSGTVNITLTVA